MNILQERLEYLWHKHSPGCVANIMKNNGAYCNKIVNFLVRTVRTAERIIVAPLPSLAASKNFTPPERVKTS